MLAFKRLLQALGLNTVPLYSDSVPPRNLVDLVFWVPFGPAKYLRAKQYAPFVGAVILFVLAAYWIGLIVASWVHCSECSACQRAIPEDQAGGVLVLPQGDLFCLRSGWAGFSPRIGQVKRSSALVTFRHPQDVTRVQTVELKIGSDIPNLRKLLRVFYFEEADK